jgi:hypothetical protein
MRPRRALPDGRLVRQLMADLLADGTSSGFLVSAYRILSGDLRD